MEPIIVGVSMEMPSFTMTSFRSHGGYHAQLSRFYLDSTPCGRHEPGPPWEYKGQRAWGRGYAYTHSVLHKDSEISYIVMMMENLDLDSDLLES